MFVYALVSVEQRNWNVLRHEVVNSICIVCLKVISTEVQLTVWWLLHVRSSNVLSLVKASVAHPTTITRDLLPSTTAVKSHPRQPWRSKESVLGVVQERAQPVHQLPKNWFRHCWRRSGSPGRKLSVCFTVKGSILNWTIRWSYARALQTLSPFSSCLWKNSKTST